MTAHPVCRPGLTGATDLFEEPGTLDQAAASARAWFVAHLAPARARTPV